MHDTTDHKFALIAKSLGQLGFESFRWDDAPNFQGRASRMFANFAPEPVRRAREAGFVISRGFRPHDSLFITIWGGMGQGHWSVTQLGVRVRG